MKGKSIAAQIITTVILLLGTFGGYFTGTTAAIIGIVSYALTLFLSTFMASGSMPTGWTIVMWATNIGGVLTQIVIASHDAGLLAANVTNGIIAVINIILQVYFTDKVLTNTTAASA